MGLFSRVVNILRLPPSCCDYADLFEGVRRRVRRNFTRRPSIFFETKLHQFGYDTTELVLSQNGRCLEDDLTLAEAGINELATVEVFSRVVGGKVHGSLARAGKVKGQTPKVDPQEKKKKKTGR